MAVVSNVKIVPAIVVVIAHAHALAPARSNEPGVLGHVGKGAVVIVVVEMIRGRVLSRWTLQSGPIDEENIRPAVIVVIEDCHASACCLDDVLLGFPPAEYVQREQSGFLGLIGKMHDGSGFCLGTGR